MHIVLLLHQSSDGTTHRDDIIVGMRREDDDALGIRQSPFGTETVIDPRLATGPSGDGVLEFIEHGDVYETCLTVELFDEMSQAIVLIILRRQFQQGLPYLTTKTDHLPAQGMLRHLDS